MIAVYSGGRKPLAANVTPGVVISQGDLRLRSQFRGCVARDRDYAVTVSQQFVGDGRTRVSCGPVDNNLHVS